ncbi:MAG: hypothetical protein KatS3mg071_0763 [Meiothermus sp.]|nr:MAG: hypothetical protein KatS3mg071_0763 [Meiothermus sp.]
MKKIICLISISLLCLGGVFGVAGVILTVQWLLVGFNPSIRGNSLNAQVARAVYRNFFDKEKAKVFVAKVLECGESNATCIGNHLRALDPHMAGNDFGLTKRREPSRSTAFGQAAISLGKVKYLRIPDLRLPHPIGGRESNIRFLDPIAEFLATTTSQHQLVLDLRDCGGGRDWAALTLASPFISSGTVVEASYSPVWMLRALSSILEPRQFTDKGVRSKVAFSLELPSAKKVYPKAIYIVVNRGTASACEYMALVLKKYSSQKVIFVGDQSSAGMGNTSITPVKVSGRTIYVTSSIVRGLPPSVKPEMSIAEMERDLGFQLSKLD